MQLSSIENLKLYYENEIEKKEKEIRKELSQPYHLGMK